MDRLLLVTCDDGQLMDSVVDVHVHRNLVLQRGTLILPSTTSADETPVHGLYVEPDGTVKCKLNQTTQESPI